MDLSRGPVAVVGIFRPREGVIYVAQLVRGQNLATETLRDALAGIQPRQLPLALPRHSLV